MTVVTIFANKQWNDRLVFTLPSLFTFYCCETMDLWYSHICASTMLITITSTPLSYTPQFFFLIPIVLPNEDFSNSFIVIQCTCLKVHVQNIYFYGFYVYTDLHNCHCNVISGHICQVKICILEATIHSPIIPIFVSIQCPVCDNH